MAAGMLSRRGFAALLAGGMAGAASAQPAGRPVRIVLGFAAGGGSDAMMRVLALQLTQQLGQTVLIDNRPGAEGVIAADSVARAAPDGTTLFFASNGPLVALPILRGKASVSYDPFKDFTPVALMGRFTMVMVAAPNLPVRDFREFVQYARSKPGGLNYASANTVTRMAAIQLMAQTKTELVHVPYKGDSAALLDLMADRVQMMFTTAAAVRGHVKENKVRPLLVLGNNRSPLLPDVPTATEAGVRITASPWAGLYAPANTPAATVERLNKALRASLSTAEVRDQMDKLGFEPTPSSPAEMAALHRAEYDLFDKTVNQDGVKFE